MRARLLLFAWALSAGHLAAQTFPMEGGDLRRSNHVPGVPAWTFPLQLQWEFQSACLGGANANPTVLPDKVVFTDGWHVAALARGDGQLLWSWDPRTDGKWNSPTWDADRDRLYIGSWTGALYALDAATGSPLWMLNDGHSTYGGCMAAPVYLDDKIIYKDGKQSYVCLDADTQAELWRWSFTADQLGVTPALDGGLLYVAGTRGEMACINAATGATVWHRHHGRKKPYAGAVLLTDTKLYVQTAPGLVECRLRSNGNLVWEYQNFSYGMGNLACDGTTLYCTNDDRNTRAFDCEDGTLKWIRKHDGNFARSGAFVCGGTVFSSGCTGEFYGDSAATGSNDWLMPHGAGNSFNDWAYADGDLYVSNREGKFFCFRNPCASCSPTVSPTISPTPSQSAALSPSPTETATPTPSSSITASVTPSLSPTMTASPTATLTATPSRTPTGTPSFSRTVTPSATLTFSSTLTVTPSPTLTATSTPSASPVITATRTASPSGPAAKITPGHCITYPNPVRGDHMTCAFDMPKPGRARVVIVDARGRPVLEAQDHFPAGPAALELDVRQLRKGVFFQRVGCHFDDGTDTKLAPGRFSVLR